MEIEKDCRLIFLMFSTMFPGKRFQPDKSSCKTLCSSPEKNNILYTNQITEVFDKTVLIQFIYVYCSSLSYICTADRQTDRKATSEKHPMIVTYPKDKKL
jgi:hypothetical protein